MTMLSRRRLRRGACELLCRTQPDRLRHTGTTLISLVHDFEGEYAMAGMRSASLHGVRRMLDIEERHGIRGTYCTVGRYALQIPDTIREIHARGHEVASHSFEHRVYRTMTGAEKAADIDNVRRAFAELKIPICGHRSPQSAWDFQLTGILARSDFSWSAEFGTEPRPYVITRYKHHRLWRLPVRDDDWCYQQDGLEPAAALARWQEVIKNARRHRRYTAIGFHPWVQASTERLAAFAQFVTWLTALPDVRVLPCRQIVTLLEGRHSITDGLPKSAAA